jgi:hypothetical protein
LKTPRKGPFGQKLFWVAPLVWVLATLLVTCGPPNTSSGTPPEKFCPGAPGCDKGFDGKLKIGIASAKITPTAFEQPRPHFLRVKGTTCTEGSPQHLGQLYCGKLLENAFQDCGLDTICPNDDAYVAADADGTERDGKDDYFFDCGTDQVCPGQAGYAGPDSNGTEGDGKFQGVWLAGFGTSRPAWGVHDDLYTRAVAFQNGDTTIVMAAVDVVGLFYDDIVRIRARAKELATAAGVDIDYMLIAATHLHEGPDTEGQWGPARGGLIPSRGVDDAWFNGVLLENTAQAAVEAVKSARLAKLFVNQGHLGDLVNSVVEDGRDPVIIDDAVTTMKFVDASTNEVFGSLVSWANHPETLADTNALITADYTYYLRAGIEKGLFLPDTSKVADGLGGTTIFFNGALGGMMSPLGAHPKSLDGTEPPSRSFAKAQAIGEITAKFALGLLADAKEVKSPQIAFGAQTVKIKIENEVFHLAFQANILKRRIYDYDRQKAFTATNIPRVQSEISKVYIGPVHFLGMPGEPLPELGIGYDSRWSFGRDLVNSNNPNPPKMDKAPPGPYLKELVGGEFPCILGLANDHVGYLIPSYNYELNDETPYYEDAPGDHYEETNSVGPSVTPNLLTDYEKLFGWQPYKEM